MLERKVSGLVVMLYSRFEGCSYEKDSSVVLDPVRECPEGRDDTCTRRRSTSDGTRLIHRSTYAGTRHIRFHAGPGGMLTASEDTEHPRSARMFLLGLLRPRLRLRR